MDVLQQNDLEYLFSKVAPQTAEATSINAATSASNLTVSTTSGDGSTTLSLFAPPTASSSDSGASLSQFLCQTLELPAVDDSLAQQPEAASTSPVATATTAATLVATGAHISNINNINRAIQETVSGFENSAQLHKLFKTEGSESGELQALPAIFDLPPLPATDAGSAHPSPGKVSSSSSPSSTEFCTPASSPLSQQLVMQEADSSETPSPLLPPYPLAPLASSSLSSSAARKRSMEDAGLSSGSSSFPSVPVVNSGGFNDAPRLSIDIHSQRTSIDNSAVPDEATSALSSSVSSPRSSFQDEVEPSQEQLEELYAMMEWSSDLRFRPAKRKRESKTKEARKKKHILSEQRRRNHMNEAIDTLKAYLPGQNVESPEAESAASGQSKKTKVAVLKESTVFLSRMRELTLRLIDENKRLDSENKSLKEQLKRLPLPLDLAQQQHQQQQAFALSGLPTHMTQPLYSTAPMMTTLPAAPYYAQAQVVQQQLDQRLNELRMQQLQQQPPQQVPVQHTMASLAQVFPQQQQQQQQPQQQPQQQQPQQQQKTDFPLIMGASTTFSDFPGMLPFYSAQDAFAHVDPNQNPASGLVNRRFAAGANAATTTQTQQQQQQQQQQSQQSQQQAPSGANGDSERNGFLSQQGSRLLFGVFFMMFVAFGAPWDSIAYSDSGMPLAAPGRVLMSDADFTADSQWAGYLPSVMFYLKWVLLTTACYIILILWRTSRICHQFQKASHDLQVTDIYLKRGNMRQAESSSRDCLEHLGSPLPSGHAARFAMTAWEMVRHVLHIVFIGRFIETVMMYARNDVAMASMQARALSVFLKTHEKLDTEWLYAALTAFNTAQATQNLSLQAEVNLGIMLRLHGNPYLTKLFAPYIRYRSWLVVRKSAASGQELGWVYYGEAITCMCAGQLKQAARYLKKVARVTKNNTVLKRQAAIYLALICTLRGKPAKGRQLYKWVYQASLLGNDLVTLCLALLGLVRSLMATNELNEAQEVLSVLEQFPWKSLNRSDRILFRALQAYVHLRSGRIEPAFAIASGLHKEIEEEETVRYHAKFYSFLSYQALAEVSLGLYEELAKNNDQLKGKVTSEEMENMASASLMHVNMFAEAYPVNKPCALRCHAAYSHITLGPSAVGKAKYYCERALTTAREMKLRVEEDRCQQALQKYLLLDAVSTV